MSTIIYPPHTEISCCLYFWLRMASSANHRL